MSFDILCRKKYNQVKCCRLKDFVVYWKVFDKEMKRLTEKYAWIKFENCTDEFINRNIKMLNILKSEDLYPLYLLLLDSIFQENILELRKIFSLLTNYMLRFRIVAPSGGGGALRSIIHELIEDRKSVV